MRDHPDHLYSAWDQAINDLDNAVEAFRTAIGVRTGDKTDDDMTVLAADVTKRKKAAMDAWAEYVNAAGFGRI